jgi:hypothetical protein
MYFEMSPPKIRFSSVNMLTVNNLKSANTEKIENPLTLASFISDYGEH